MANGSTPMPSWADTLSRIVIQVGFPTVVAGYLLYFILGDFKQGLVAITDRMGGNAQAVEKLITTMEAQTIELKAQTIYLSKLTEMAERREREKHP